MSVAACWDPSEGNTACPDPRIHGLSVDENVCSGPPLVSLCVQPNTVLKNSISPLNCFMGCCGNQRREFFSLCKPSCKSQIPFVSAT